MNVPSFYILGAPKCGARTIEAWLRGRDDIFLPTPGLENFHATDIQDRLNCSYTYDQAFARGGDRLSGEVSCWYLYSNDAIPNILSQNPDAKFIVCLNNPADVAWALHSDYVNNSVEHIRDFNTAWALSFARRKGRGARMTDDPKLLDYASICSLGRQVTRLLAQVPRDRIQFVFFDDLRERPGLEWRKLEDFLGLKHETRDAWPIEDLVIQRPLVPLHELVMSIKRRVRRIFPRQHITYRLESYVNGFNRRPAPLPAMPTEAREKVSDRLSEDIAILSVLTERDLTDWVA